MSDFESFWNAYPRKVGKAMARSKWNAITGNGLQARCKDRDGNVMDMDLYSDPVVLVEAAKAYRYASIDTEARFIAHPTTWLNQGRWEDYDDDERRQMARNMDKILERAERPKLRVVG